ncbi:MAG TPA: hypothetical protein VFR85_10700 [Anaeromyxobacteraceae bacterium]|nr:hypothetical protein [Anaeromyxobacteraceae bacterium]
MTAHAATAASLALLLAAPARGDGEGEVRGFAALHLRLTSQANLPSNDLLFDPGSRAFEVSSYLGPSPGETFAAWLLSAGFEGSHLEGRLAWALAVDSGLLRTQRFPRTVPVCTSSSLTGLDLPGRGTCIAPPGWPRPLVFLVPSTSAGSPELTSNGRPVAEEAEDTFFVREAWAEGRLGRAGFLSIRAGRQRIAVGDGFVHDDYALGISLDADLGAIGPQLDLRLNAFWPTRGRIDDAQLRSPMLALRADWTPSLLEHVGIFAAWAHDETGWSNQLLRAANTEAAVLRLQESAPGTATYRFASWVLAALLSTPPAGTSDLVWTGLSGHLFLADRHELWWTGAVVLGQVAALVGRGVDQPPDLQDIPVQGWLGRLRWRFPLTPALAAGAFLVYQSGDLPPVERALVALPVRYDGFLGVTPYVTDLNLFFNGGISESFADRRAAAPGVNGRGAVAPGLALAWDPSVELSLEGRGAWLWADQAGPYGGRAYGVEVDMNAAWSPWPWLSLLAEADALFAGDFFPSRATMWRLILGVNLATP